MRRPPPSAQDGPGQDSFLDIVANLVGILIILVMVVGVRAKDAILEASPVEEESAALQTARSEVDSVGANAAALEADVFAIDAKVKRQQFDIEFRRAERERVQLLVAAAEAQLEEERQELEGAARKQFDDRRAAIAAKTELEELTNQIRSLQNAAAPVAVLEHLPTPMAKTIFGDELHVSLQNGRVMLIPGDQLIEELKKDAPQKIRRMQDRSELTETIGPIGGFWMKYTLARKRHAVSTRVGVAVQQAVELDHFVILPVAADLGEPIADVLRADSEFWTTLSQHRPDSTTITVWTYPDSFNDYRHLKQALFPLGYLVASRPLPEGFPIGGSPKGVRSAAQ